MHECTVCLGSMEVHKHECDCDQCYDEKEDRGKTFFPALCCEGCDCRSFEEAHELETVVAIP